MRYQFPVWLLASSVLTGAWLHTTTSVAQGQETEESIPEMSVSDLPQQVSATNGTPSLRRRPVGNEQEFEPTRIPLQIPNIDYYRASPGVTVINPSAYGASWGNAGIGVGFQERTRFTDREDGGIGVGFGFGNPQENVGLQIGIALTDVSDPFRDGTLNLKLHRRLPSDFNIAVGVQGAATWGETDGGSSVYGVVTKRFPLKEDQSKLFSEIYASVGVGGGQFRSEYDIENDVNSVGVFGSLAVRINGPTSFIAEWTGQDLTLGVSYVPFRNLPLVIIPAVTDITGTAGDGARFIFGVGYSFSY